MPVDTAPELRFGVAKEELTGLAGLALAASLVKYLGLAEALARRVRIEQRRRGCRDKQMLLALIYSQCAGGAGGVCVDREPAAGAAVGAALPAEPRLRAGVRGRHGGGGARPAVRGGWATTASGSIGCTRCSWAGPGSAGGWSQAART